MNWIPPIFEPLNPIMVLLVVVWFMAITLAIHRVSRYVVQRRMLERWNDDFNDARRSLERGLAALPPLHAFVASLCAAVQDNASTAALGRFHEQVVVPLRTPDHWNDRGLQALTQIAPLIGLIGTVAGILSAFAGLADTEGVVLLKDLAGPVSLAMRTTLHGAACAAFCIAVRVLCPTLDVHGQVDKRLSWAWRMLAPLLNRNRESRRRPREGADLTSDDEEPRPPKGEPNDAEE